ncbi:MAG: AI-2E family transporter [Egibacteraceae bacterium]
MERTAGVTTQVASTSTMVRAGAWAWGLIGVLLLLWAGGYVLSLVSVVVIPLVLALFPAAVLMPPTLALKRRGLPDAAAALVVLVGSLLALGVVFQVLGTQVADQFTDLAEQLQEGYQQTRTFLESGPLGFAPVQVDELIQQGRERLASEGQEIGTRVVEAGILVVEGFTGLVLMLFALFFYLKDGPRLARWARGLFPRSWRTDVSAIADRVWFTIGAYIRGQLLIGLVDAVAIGIGLAIIGVPLAPALSVLVFFGALFPIVGAFLAGTVAVLVALATNGVAPAVAVLVLIVAVQQVEGHVLAPVLLGRATALHPLAVIAALTSGGILLGVLGAFLGVPVAASIARSVGYLRNRDTEPVKGRDPTAAVT